METILATCLTVLIPATFMVFALAIYRQRQLAVYLQKNHPALWAEIAPVRGAQSSVSSPFAKFITERRYDTLSEIEATTLGDGARKAFYLAVTLFFILIAAGLAVSLLPKT